MSRDNTHQVVELFLNRFQIVKNVRVVELEVIKNQRPRAVVHELGALIKEGAVVFIGFNHEEWALAQACGNIEVTRQAANDEAWLVATGFEDPGRHPGGGGFTVRTSNRHYPAVAQHEIVQPLWARHVRNVFLQHRFHARITARHRVADDHQIRLRIKLACIITLN